MQLFTVEFRGERLRAFEMRRCVRESAGLGLRGGQLVHQIRRLISLPVIVTNSKAPTSALPASPQITDTNFRVQSDNVHFAVLGPSPQLPLRFPLLLARLAQQGDAGPFPTQFRLGCGTARRRSCSSGQNCASQRRPLARPSRRRAGHLMGLAAATQPLNHLPLAHVLPAAPSHITYEYVLRAMPFVLSNA